MIFTLSTGNNFKSTEFLDSGFSILNLKTNDYPGELKCGDVKEFLFGSRGSHIEYFTYKEIMLFYGEVYNTLQVGKKILYYVTHLLFQRKVLLFYSHHL